MGAFGEVHFGDYIGQPVVVKMLLIKEPTLDAIKEILDEALIMKKYNFEFFATVYGICVIDKSPAIVMKRMDSDLYRFLSRRDKKNITSSMAWKLQTATAAAKAVEALHVSNLIDGCPFLLSQLPLSGYTYLFLHETKIETWHLAQGPQNVSIFSHIGRLTHLGNCR